MCLFDFWLNVFQVYVAYLTFQLWSHSHLYEDSAAGIHSRGCSKKSGKVTKGKELASPVLQPGLLSTGEQNVLDPPPRRSQSPSSFPRSFPSAPDISNADSLRDYTPQNTLRLVHPTPQRGTNPVVPMNRTETASSDRSDVTLTEGEEHPNPFGQELEAVDEKEVYVPQLSWFMTVFILSVVSLVRAELALPKKAVLINPFTACGDHCRLVGCNGERDFCNQIHQQGMDGSHSVAYCAGDRRYASGLKARFYPYRSPRRLCDSYQRLGQRSIDAE